MKEHERRTALKAHLAFRAVNRPDQPGYDADLQRHHILPRRLLGIGCFSPMLEAIGHYRNLFHDFRLNGLLLPCSEDAALRLALPLHRGPHTHYSGLVIERVGQIEASWSRGRLSHPRAAAVEASMRLTLLQGALRRFLLSGTRRKVVLNRRDPLRAKTDFLELDAMAEALWGASAHPQPSWASSSSLAA